MGNERPPEQPQPLDMAEQMARVTKNIIDWTGTPAEVEIHPGEYSDVEAFLEANAPLFSAVDTLWDEADAAYQAFYDALSRVAVITYEPNEDGTLIQVVQDAKGRSYRGERREAPQSSNKLLLMSSWSSIAYDESVRFTHAPVFRRYATKHLSDENLDEILAAAVATKAAKRQRSLAEDDEFNNAVGEIAELRRQTAFSYEDATLKAFVAQRLALIKLDELLVDGNLILPFTSRLEELTALAEQGLIEFPGLLETLQVHILQTQQYYPVSALEDAIWGCYDYITPRDAFVDDLLTEDVDTLKEGLTNASNDFLLAVASVQVVANAVSMGEGSGITREEIKRRVTEHFNMMPDEWVHAYGDTKDYRAETLWDRVSVALRKFERRGRLKSDATTEDLRRAEDTPFEKSRSTRQKKGKKPKRRGNPGPKPPTASSQAAAADMATKKEAPSPISTFALLDSTEDVKNNVHALRHVDGLDGLMTSDIVAGFLQSHPPDFAGALRTCFEQLASQPLGASNVSVLSGEAPYRLPGSKQASTEYRFRLFSNEGALQQGVRTELPVDRIRIQYGLCVVNGARCLTIKNVSLSDQTHES